MKYSTLSFGRKFVLKEKLYREQLGKCALCGGDYTLKKLQLDHCHRSDDVRMLLCRRCNTLLGVCNDDPVLLQKAIFYLQGVRYCLACEHKLANSAADVMICPACEATNMFGECIVEYDEWSKTMDFSPHITQKFRYM